MVLVVIGTVVRNKRGLYVFQHKAVPVHITEPGVLHDLLRPVVPESILWLTLNKLVYKIYCLLRPSHWNVPFLYLYLLRQDLIPYLLSAPTRVGPKSEYAFKCYDPQSIVVGCNPVTAPANHLRGHVPRSA